MPDADTDTRAGLDLEVIQERLAIAKLKAQINGWQSDAVYELVNGDLLRLLAEVRRLREELTDARQEIARHHRQYDEWEEMAAKGARSIEERRKLRVVADAAREAATAYFSATSESTVVLAMQPLTDALDASAPPHVAGEGAEGANPGSNQ